MGNVGSSIFRVWHVQGTTRWDIPGSVAPKTTKRFHVLFHTFIYFVCIMKKAPGTYHSYYIIMLWMILQVPLFFFFFLLHSELSWLNNKSDLWVWPFNGVKIHLLGTDKKQQMQKLVKPHRNKIKPDQWSLDITWEFMPNSFSCTRTIWSETGVLKKN